jgi:hypothetical protein
MLYKEIARLSFSKFKRLTGVKREVFDQMLDTLNQGKAASRKHPRRGAAAKLSSQSLKSLPMPQ